MSSYKIENFELDHEKLEKIKIKVIAEEKKNVKTKGITKEAMVENLRDIIIEEVKRKY